MKLFQTIYSTIHNKCPRCHKGDVFVHKNPYSIGNMFNMHKNCSHCNLKYEKEFSFFYGAMYASYGLTAGWFLVWYFINSYFMHMELLSFAILITISIVLLSPVSVRLSRLLWLNLFNKYDKHYNPNNIKQPLS